MKSLHVGHANEVPGRLYKTPKELWGFRLPPASGDPAAVARRILDTNARRLGVEGISGMLRPRRVIRSLGAWHVIFSQRHMRHFIHRAYVTVHMDARKSVYLVKNRAVPASMLPEVRGRVLTIAQAQRIAVASIRRKRADLTVHQHEEVWFPLRTRLHLAHKFRLLRRTPAEEWIVYVDAATGAILSKYDNLAQATGRAHVFDPNPVVALGGWRDLLDGEQPVRRVPPGAYKPVQLTGLVGGGVLNGPRVTTALTRHRVRRPNLDFRCRSDQEGFEEVMVYYHLDQAVKYIERLGYRGDRAIFSRKLEADARATREDNSWYSPATRSLAFGTGAVDDAEDGETIVHEFGHAVQDAICPDFGQSPEAAAMGEGFGDYLAASFFAARKMEKLAAGLLPAVMTWDGILCPDPRDPDGRPPCVRRVDSDVTYESFDHGPRADEHDNGVIWSSALWAIWNEVGKAIADTIIVESHFQLDGFTTFAKGARAILDADRNLFHGRHLTPLKRIFARRGIGPVE
jgi:hypothetical protein